ncbi:TRAP transporter large permease subunit [Ahrensia sp. R2A130]|uniref:TRAP transporter large permease n=1 Tax=Ahrensia sp. R2A130 TaxID=744979 RepID=UPI0001E0BC9D|nr:TRAP transporter large permease subunit [Ahrensia sp. R2A130]EFL88766.1 C4 dicarboxylate ABC transporter permease [Ahrensia sp. R2A130]
MDIVFACLALLLLLAGYPVAITLGGFAVLFAVFATLVGAFDLALLGAIPSRVFGIVTNPILLAIPFFVLMGAILERSRIAAEMLEAATHGLRGLRGGAAVSVTLVGALLAASTGIVGASVVTLGLLALPVLLSRGVAPNRAAGTVAAVGTLGQIVPPSIVLIVLGDQLSNAWQTAQTSSGNFAPDTVSVADLFAASILPGALLVGLFVCWQILRGDDAGQGAQPVSSNTTAGSLSAFVPPFALVVAVLGSILSGIATPSEAAAVGAFGAALLGSRKLGWNDWRHIASEGVHLTCTIFTIIIGASIFALVLRGLGGDETLAGWLSDLPGGAMGALAVVMLTVFLLGFVLDFIEITYVVLPLAAPVLLTLPMADGSTMSPVWLGVLLALNLQTSFLTPPFGLSLFYLRSVAPKQITTAMMYRGVVPYIGLQLLALALVFWWPSLATSLPNWFYGAS